MVRWMCVMDKGRMEVVGAGALVWKVGSLDD